MSKPILQWEAVKLPIEYAAYEGETAFVGKGLEGYLFIIFEGAHAPAQEHGYCSYFARNILQGPLVTESLELSQEAIDTIWTPDYCLDSPKERLDGLSMEDCLTKCEKHARWYLEQDEAMRIARDKLAAFVKAYKSNGYTVTTV